jgi:hypothetical protein
MVSEYAFHPSVMICTCPTTRTWQMPERGRWLGCGWGGFASLDVGGSFCVAAVNGGTIKLVNAPSPQLQNAVLKFPTSCG